MVISSGDLYCLLPQCEALRTCVPVKTILQKQSPSGKSCPVLCVFFICYVLRLLSCTRRVCAKLEAATAVRELTQPPCPDHVIEGTGGHTRQGKGDSQNAVFGFNCDLGCHVLSSNRCLGLLLVEYDVRFYVWLTAQRWTTVWWATFRSFSRNGSMCLDPSSFPRLPFLRGSWKSRWRHYWNACGWKRLENTAYSNCRFGI